MCAKSMFANYDSPSRRSTVHHFRFPRNAKRVDMNDAKLALNIIIRPSLQLWKLALGRSGILTTLKRPPKSASLCDSASSTSSISLKVLSMSRCKDTLGANCISRRVFDLMISLSQFPAGASLRDGRRILVRHLHVPASLFAYVTPSFSDYHLCSNRLQENGDTYKNFPSSPLKTDCPSVYEDCLSDYPDLEVFESNQPLGTRWSKRIRRSEFYQMESGIAMFDQAGYASYCLSRWLEKQREETRGPKKRVFEDPALLSQPSRTLPLPPPSSDQLDISRPVPQLSTPVCRSMQSFPWRMCKHIEDELQNAIVVLVIGLFIHICLFLFLVYDILTRGFIPSDD